MVEHARLWRSVLYLPASKARALEKAREVDADALIFDLEDAVAPDEKAAARDLLVAALHDDYGQRARIVRINGLDTPWGAKDAAAIAAHPGVDAVLVPKVGSAADLDAVAALVGAKPLWAMMESPMGILHAAEIAAHPRLEGMVMGTNDLTRDLRSADRADRLAMQPALGLCLLAARAYGRVIVDGVYNAFRDDTGLAAECAQGRDLGFDGKSLIHPAQLAITNAAFGPDAATVTHARAQIAAFDAAMQRGEAIAVLEGRIVENMHAAAAQRLIAQADAIAARAE